MVEHVSRSHEVPSSNLGRLLLHFKVSINVVIFFVVLRILVVVRAILLPTLLQQQPPHQPAQQPSPPTSRPPPIGIDDITNLFISLAARCLNVQPARRDGPRPLTNVVV